MKKNRQARTLLPLLEYLEPRILLTVVNSPLIPGDANADGTVNIVDLAQISQRWQQAAAAPYDVNGDNFVDLMDYTIASQNWQETIYDGRSVVAGGVLNVWIPDAADAGTDKWLALSSELYGTSGMPVITDIQTGNIDDSYFLAAVGSLAASQPAKIISAISYDGTGWAVSFDGTQTGQQSAVVHVSREFSWDIQPRVPGAGVWWQVMEKAYAWYRTWNGATSQNSFASLQGGSLDVVWKTLGQASTTLNAASTPVDTVITLLRSSLSQGKPIVFSTFAASPWLTPNHSYVLISITGTGTNANVVTFDPYGFYDFWTMNELLLSGSTFTLGL